MHRHAMVVRQIRDAEALCEADRHPGLGRGQLEGLAHDLWIEATGPAGVVNDHEYP